MKASRVYRFRVRQNNQKKDHAHSSFWPKLDVGKYHRFTKDSARSAIKLFWSAAWGTYVRGMVKKSRFNKLNPFDKQRS